MSNHKRWCLNCRLLELRRSPSGEAVYWCVKKGRPLGSSVLGRPACSRFAAWTIEETVEPM